MPVRSTGTPQTAFSSVLFPLPGGIVAPAERHLFPAQRQHVVHAPVQKIPVVADQQKAVLLLQIPAHTGAAFRVQMICGLIDEAISLFLHKQRGQHALDLLPAGQCGKRAGQRLPAQTQAVRLAGTAPFRRIRCKGAQQLPRGQGRVRHRKREQHAGRTPAHGSAVRQPAGQQPQQRSFAPAVAPGQSQPPPGVYGKAHIFKQRIAAVIGKREMFYGNLRHTSASFQQKNRGTANRTPQGRSPPHPRLLSSKEARTRKSSRFCGAQNKAARRSLFSAVQSRTICASSHFPFFSLL